MTSSAHAHLGGTGELVSRAPDRWIFTQGDFTSRRLLHQHYGGSLLRGIAPSTKSSHVFLFTADRLPGGGWRQDGFYYYAGTSSPTGGAWENDLYNKAVETSWNSGRRLHLLAAPRRGARGLWRFVDSFKFDGIAEELITAGPQGAVVRYPLYRLRSIESVTHQPGQLLPPGDPRLVDIRRVERCDLLCKEGREHSLDNERPETRLSKAFERYLMSQGYAVHRMGILHTPDCAPLLTDTWVAQLRLLIEAKAGRNPTDDVRYALGQLGQYTRHLPGVLRKAVLLPYHPGRELQETALYMGADLIWPDGPDWHTTGDWGRLIGMTRLRR
ncbi:hypothetical protein [Streptomyces sp. NPDC020951]|uniref:hypothetical protein n=1 Tax=Streptomyces sp. NPDC020951 TaxID=3365104 RepID=UPI0037943030